MAQKLYELPEGWKWTAWTDALEIIGGKNQKDVVTDDGQYAIYGSGGEMGRATKFLCPAYTTIIGRKGTINKPQYIEQPFWNVDTAFGLAPNEQLDTKLFFYFCCSFNFLTLNRSTTLPSLTKRDLYTLKIPLPPLNEQKRIVAKIDALFTRIDTAITHLQQTLELSKALFASALDEAFQKSASTRGVLTDVVNFIGGSQPPKAQFSDTEHDGYVRLIQIRDYKSDAYKVYVKKESTKKFCSADDVMIGRYGPPVFQILRGLDGAYNVALMKAVPDEVRLSKVYLFWFLRSPSIQHYIVSISQRAAGQSGVNKKALEKYKIPLPTLDEQQGIVSHLESLSERIGILEISTREKINDLTALKASLLDAAFKGEL